MGEHPNLLSALNRREVLRRLLFARAEFLGDDRPQRVLRFCRQHYASEIVAGRPMKGDPVETIWALDTPERMLLVAATLQYAALVWGMNLDDDTWDTIQFMAAGDQAAALQSIRARRGENWAPQAQTTTALAVS